jgi:hypothetical protein
MAASSDDKTLMLSGDEAFILFDWIHRLEEDGQLARLAAD